LFFLFFVVIFILLVFMKAGIDFPGVGVGVLVLRADGKFLLGKRASGSRNETGAWTFPGGKVELLEKLEDACRRETKEEFGIDIEIVRLLKLINHFTPEKQHWVNPIFLARLVSGEPQIMEPEKFSRFNWFSVEELPFPLTVNLQELFQDVKAGKISIAP
jgi:mutator protein MutT